MADVFATVVAFWPFLMADGIAIVVDGIATFVMTDVIVIWEMEKPFCVTADVPTVVQSLSAKRKIHKE